MLIVLDTFFDFMIAITARLLRERSTGSVKFGRGRPTVPLLLSEVSLPEQQREEALCQ